MRANFGGLTEWRSRLARLTEGLAHVAGGAAQASATKDVAALMLRVAKRRLAGHVASEHALKTCSVAATGSLVTLTVAAYVATHQWWLFRRGAPTGVLKAAATLVARAYLAAIGDNDGAVRALALASTEAEDERIAAKAATVFKRETAKIARRMYRESPEGKAARRAEAAKRRAAKRSASS